MEGLLGRDDVNVNENGIGSAPLHYACMVGHEAIARLLLEKGAEVDKEDYGEVTPLHIVSGNGNDAVARLLLEKGAEVDKGNAWGYTPLHLACANGHEAVARLLLEEGGADVHKKNTWGRTPLSEAQLYGGQAVVQVLEWWLRLTKDQRQHQRRGIVQYGRHYWAKREWATMRALCQQGRANATDQKHSGLCSRGFPDKWFQRIISCAYAGRTQAGSLPAKIMN